MLSCCRWTFWICRDPLRGVSPRHSYKCCGVCALDVAFSRNLQALCSPKKPKVGFLGVLVKNCKEISLSSVCIAPNLVASHAGFPGLEEISLRQKECFLYLQIILFGGSFLLPEILCGI